MPVYTKARAEDRSGQGHLALFQEVPLSLLASGAMRAAIVYASNNKAPGMLYSEHSAARPSV